MFMKITDFESKLISLSGQEFENLVFEIICREFKNTKNIEHTGNKPGTNKSAPGPIDCWFSIEKDDGLEYTFVAVTNQQKGLYGKKGKIYSDLYSIKKYAEEGGFAKFNILYVAAHNIDPAHYNEYDTYCKNFGSNLDVWSLDTLIKKLRNYEDVSDKYLDTHFNAGSITELNLDNLYSSSLLPIVDKFLFRKDEITKITNLLFDSKILIVTGKTGCGKTRLCLEVANNLKITNNIKPFIIKKSNPNIINDLSRIVGENDDVLLLLDDAEKNNDIVNLFDYINSHPNKRIYLLITIRDFLFESFKNNLLEYEVKTFALRPLTNSEIEEIIKKNFNIQHRNYLNYILEVSRGNLRIAVVTASVLRGQHLTFNSISDVFKSYFDGVASKLGLSSDTLTKLEHFIVAVSYFENLDLRKEDFVRSVCDVFKIEFDDFKNLMFVAYNNEIIDQQYDYKLISINDQTLATYLFYKYVIELKLIKLSDIFNSFSKKKADFDRFIKLIITICSVFGLSDFLKDELINLLSSIDGVAFLTEYLNSFMYILPEKAIDFSFNELLKYDGDNIETNSFYNDLQTDQALILSRLASHKKYCEVCIEKLFFLFDTKDNLTEVLTKAIVEGCSIQYESIDEEYYSQIYLINQLKNRVGLSRKYDELLLKYLDKNYSFEIEEFQNNRFVETEKFIISRFLMPFDNNFKIIRKDIWDSVRVLIKQGHYFRTLELLSKQHFSAFGNISQHISLDYECKKEVAKSIKGDNLKEKIIKYALIVDKNPTDDVLDIIKDLRNDWVVKLFFDYIYERTAIHKYGDELSRQITNDLSKNHSLKNLVLDVCNLEQIISEKDVWKLNSIVNCLFEMIIKNEPDNYNEYVRLFFDTNPNTRIQPFCILRKIRDKLDLVNYFEGFEGYKCLSIRATFFMVFTKDEITDYIYKKAQFFFLTSYNIDKRRWGTENILSLTEYDSYRAGFIYEIVNNYIEKPTLYDFIESLLYGDVEFKTVRSMLKNDDKLVQKLLINLSENTNRFKFKEEHIFYLLSFGNENFKKILSTLLKANDIQTILNALSNNNCFVESLIEYIDCNKFSYIDHSLSRLFIKLPDTIYQRFIYGYSQKHFNNSSKLFVLSSFSKSGETADRIKLLDELIKNGVDAETLSKLDLMNGPNSWSGSFTTYLQKDIDALQSYYENDKYPGQYRLFLLSLIENRKRYLINIDISEKAKGSGF